MTEIFKNSPLIQVVCEVRFPGEPAVECHRDEFYESIRTEFPKVFVPEAKHGEHLALSPYTFKNEEETELINVAINRFSLMTFKYQGFDLFRVQFLKYFKLFCQRYRIGKLNRLGLRYINHIPILRNKEGIIPLSDYLNFGYKLPESIPQTLTELGTVLVLKRGEGHLRILIQHQQLEDPQRTEIVLLDFDYNLTQDLTSDRIGAVMDISHQHTKDVFLNIISDRYLQVMRGE